MSQSKKQHIIYQEFVDCSADIEKTKLSLLEKHKIRISVDKLLSLIESDEFETWIDVQLTYSGSVIALKSYKAMLKLMEEILAELEEQSDEFSSLQDKSNFYGKLVQMIGNFERNRKKLRNENTDLNPADNLRLRIEHERYKQNKTEQHYKENLIKLGD
jgi:hypothetical protein